MRSFALAVLLALGVSCFAAAQQPQDSGQGPGQSQAPPRSDQARADQDKDREAEAGESSSRDTRIDLSPPKDDVKNHPNSGAAVSDTQPDAAPDVQELHPWNPYRANKDVEVGDFYFRRKNYRAALERYQDALAWKENDAMANFRMAQCLEKLDQPEEAVTHYKEYLRILPDGPLSKDAKKALEKLGTAEKRETSQKTPAKQ